MSQPISFFTHYKQKENQATNAVGMIFKLLYQESPRAFADLLGTLAGTEGAVPFGYDFRQQDVAGASVPDLVIEQAAVRVVVETKNHDWFYSDQLTRHLDSFSASGGTQVLIVLSNFDHADYKQDIFDRHQEVVLKARTRGIHFVALDFLELCEHLNAIPASASFMALFQEFRGYLEGQDLLGAWQTTLDVVNCGQMHREFEQGYYICPHGPSAYSHRRAAFIGAYWQKAVRLVARIRGVVRIDLNAANFTLLTNNGKPADKKNLFDAARDVWSRVEPWRREENKIKPLQLFILEEPYPTEFSKDTSGGMFGAKIYFPIGKVSSSQELAERLKKTNWTKLQSNRLPDL